MLSGTARAGVPMSCGSIQKRNAGRVSVSGRTARVVFKASLQSSGLRT
jgi:hypothetical protein